MIISMHSFPLYFFVVQSISDTRIGLDFCYIIYLTIIYFSFYFQKIFLLKNLLGNGFLQNVDNLNGNMDTYFVATVCLI